MAIDLTQQSFTLSDVRTVVVTEVAQDQESGDYVRELRIFGGDSAPEPPITGIDTPPTQQGRLMMTLRLRSADRRRIQISVPAMEF